MDSANIGFMNISLVAVTENGQEIINSTCFQVTKLDTVDLRKVRYKIFSFTAKDEAQTEYVNQIRFALESQSFCNICNSPKGKFEKGSLEYVPLLQQVNAKFTCADCGARFLSVLSGSLLNLSNETK